MKKFIYGVLILSLLFVIGGCGGDDDHDGPRVITETFFSDPVSDGEIQFTPPNGYTVRQDLISLLAGEDPLVTDEYRAFLDFPLGRLPLDAVVEEATLSLVIRSVDAVPPSASIPIVLELVAYPPAALGAADYDRAPLIPQTVGRFISNADVSPSGTRRVSFDVTPFVEEVQARNRDFQVRIRQDGGAVPGVVEIDDDLYPPQLTVSYF
jgi:hypothetical protein